MRWPYGADTLTEFWRRWNITLFNWCRQYPRLAVDPAGASRLGRVRQAVLLFLCVGVWHGPGWTVLACGPTPSVRAA